MAHREDTKKMPTEPKSDGASSDICVVDNSNDTSPELGCWRHSSPANSSRSTNSHHTNKSNSSLPLLTPSPPNKNKPTSSLKRMILAPSQPNSPKRPNKEIITAIEKLRPIQKYKFANPNGESPNLKFSKSSNPFPTPQPGEELTECSYAIHQHNARRSPRLSIQRHQRQQQSQQKLTPTNIQHNAPQAQQKQSPKQQIHPSHKQQNSSQKLSPQETEPERKCLNGLQTPQQSVRLASPRLPHPVITEQIILKAVQKLPETQISQLQEQQQHMQQLQQQRQHFQQQLEQVEQQLHQQLHSQQEEHLRELLPLPKPNFNTPQCSSDPNICNTSSPNPTQSNADNQPPSDTPPNSPPINTSSQHKPTFEHEYHQHIISYRKSHLVVEPPQQPSSLSWETQMEQQQQTQNLSQTHQHSQPIVLTQTEQQPQQMQSQNDQQTKIQQLPKHTESIPSPQPKQRESSTKIPYIFVPKIASIETLVNKLKNSNDPISFTTICSQEGGVRIKCNDPESYSNILKLLNENNIYLHTHQLPQDKGLRIVIKNLHSTTPPDSIRSFLTKQGLTAKYVNVLKNRFTGIPLNIFEVEIANEANIDVEKILSIRKIDSQEVTVERQARRAEPVQCHRCQSFGHSKNYCRRPFICLKCAGPHPTTECKKDKNTPGLCANCGNQHIASYKGCPVYKTERAKLLAVKFSFPPPNMDNKTQPIAIEQHKLHSQPSSHALLPQQNFLPPGQQTATNQPRQPIADAQQQIWEPNPQRFRRQQPNFNSPKVTAQSTRITIHNSPFLTRKPISNDASRKTYSQVAYEAAANSPRQLFPSGTLQSSHKPPKYTQSPLKFSLQRPQPPHNQINGQKLQQSPSTQETTKRLYNKVKRTTWVGQESSSQINDIKTSVYNNERAINRLSEKVDMLFKLVNEYLTPIILPKQNKANVIKEHEQQ